MTAVAPSVSIIVCAFTEERWSLLRRSVESALREGARAEVVLVIDNNDELLSRARVEWPPLRVIPNAGPRGLSFARNTGIAAASGDILVFLDDDAAAAPGWLAALLAPFDAADVMAVGGRAEPVWPGHPAGRQPDVLPRELHWIVGCSFTGQPDGGTVRNVMGCNMAFRAESLRAIGGFDTALGRVGSLPLGAEETDASIRLARAFPGGRIAFARDAVVVHSVGTARTTLRYVVRRSFGEGVSKAMLTRRLGRADSLSSERAYVTRILPGAMLRELSRVTPGGFTAAFAIGASVAAAGAGYVCGMLAPTPQSSATGSLHEVKA